MQVAKNHERITPQISDWYPSGGSVVVVRARAGEVAHRPKAMKADMDRFKTYIKCVSEMRAVTADRLSREEKRLIKMVRVLDCEGVSPWGTDPEVFKMFRDFFFAFMKATSIEMVHRLYVVNCAWCRRRASCVPTSSTYVVWFRGFCRD